MPNYRKIIFSDHCRERQRERHITRQQKIRVIKEFEVEYPQIRKNRKKVSRKIDGTPLIVVLKEVAHGKKAIVITAYWRD
jgi:hypothetical protein